MWVKVIYDVVQNNGLFDEPIGQRHTVPVELPDLEYTELELHMAVLESLKTTNPYYFHESSSFLGLHVEIQSITIIDSPEEIE